MAGEQRATPWCLCFLPPWPWTCTPAHEFPWRTLVFPSHRNNQELDCAASLGARESVPPSSRSGFPNNGFAILCRRGPPRKKCRLRQCFVPPETDLDVVFHMVAPEAVEEAAPPRTPKFLRPSVSPHGPTWPPHRNWKSALPPVIAARVPESIVLASEDFTCRKSLLISAMFSVVSGLSKSRLSSSWGRLGLSWRHPGP